MKKSKERIYIIIPALNPDEKMMDLIKELTDDGYKQILLVDDGSNKEAKKYFETAKTKYNCKVIAHYENMGKGRALKNAFNHLLTTEFENFDAVVTVDCDGQHKPKDVSKLVEKFQTTNENDLILGVRKFDKKVPLKSNFGNKMTRSTMSLFCGVKVSDANTGLRLFTKTVMTKFLHTAGDRFQYEINMLLETKQKDINIVEVPIETVYFENNKSTHFRPIVDSYRIYSLFFKYILASVLSFVIDFALFALFLKLTQNVKFVSYIVLSTILARVISATVNFLINKHNVFKSDRKVWVTSLMYFGLAIFSMVASAFGVDALVRYLSFNEFLAKILVDGILFIFNFIVQRDVIFTRRAK